MSWKSIAEEKYSKGIRNLAEESQHFLDLLNSFNSRMNLKTEGKLEHSDLLPEGGAWLLHLSDDTDVFVELCSYEVKNDNIKLIWVEFLPSTKEVIAEISKVNGEIIKEVILKQNEIMDFYPNMSHK